MKSLSEFEDRHFDFQIEVDPEYHPKIIGKKGAVISKIRTDHGVQINFPKKGEPNEHIITITGYEESTHAAKDDIMKIVNQLVSLFLDCKIGLHRDVSTLADVFLNHMYVKREEIEQHLPGY